MSKKEGGGKLTDEFTAKTEDTWLERMEIKLVGVIGSWAFLLANVVWFTVWIVGGHDFEWLTFWVSLEAIILSILILINENRELEHDRERAIKDYKIDLSMAKRIKRLEKKIDRLVGKE